MNVDSTSILPLDPGRAVTTPGAPSGTLVEMAREFESMLILEMLRQMRRPLFEADDEMAGLGNDTMMDTIDVELSRQLVKAGGLGLAPHLVQTLGHQLQAVAGDPAAAPTIAIGLGHSSGHQAVPLTPADPVDAGGVLPLRDRISSGFGWRLDPLDGGARFHRGVDVAAAYGRDVPAMAPGRVAFAGELAGYGTTVVVEHENGFSSRYAHLSAVTVQTGEAVEKGRSLGRVGQSGRATGPHLHFELAQNGVPVDPTAAVALAALKPKGSFADSSPSEHPTQPATAGADHED